MFLLQMSPPPHPIEPDDHRRARHLHLLKGLTERAATLAHKSADKAEAELDAPDPAPEDPTAKQSRTAPNHHRNFERDVRLVHLLITLEDRIATNAAQPRRPDTRSDTRSETRPGLITDPRRSKLRDSIHQATRNAPDRAKIRRDANTDLDEALERDPALTLPAGAILGEICDRYGLPFDVAKLPDDFLVPPVTGPP